MRKVILLTLLISLLATVLFALPKNWTQYYFKFKIDNMSELKDLTQVVSIAKVTGNTVWAFANDDEWAAFQRLGYTAEILPNPGDVVNPDMRDAGQQTRLWDSYPTYSAYVAQMYAFATNYPNLCQIIDAGTTVGGRKILFARISDNISQHEAEPEVLYSSTMHGDETTGYVLMLRLIDYLLSNYTTDTRVQNMVNNLEIWINPNANPDGTYYTSDNSVTGARRYNLNGYDLNRNFPDPWVTNPYPIQPETTIMTNLGNAHHFVLSANFHGGVEVVNYPWDGIYTLHPDNNWFVNISRAYVDSVQAVAPSNYMDYLNNGITNGAAWYVITGGRQDWHIYFRHGREVTIELSNAYILPAAELPAHWNYNYNSLLGYLENALYGLQGIVTNGSGTPLDAAIKIVGIDDAINCAVTDPANGDYIRMLLPGTYTVEVSSAGYPTRTFNNVVITAGQKTTLNVVLGQITQDIPLTTGWNLISLNVVPTNLSVSSVFSGISANLLQVKDTYSSYSPVMAAHFNTLSNLYTGNGYWVNVDSGTTLSVTGQAIDPVLTDINLNPGWNLVAYYPGTAIATATALSSVSTYLQEVRSQTQYYIPGDGNSTLTQLAPNKGYWIKVSQACTLTYPAAAR